MCECFSLVMEISHGAHGVSHGEEYFCLPHYPLFPRGSSDFTFALSTQLLSIFSVRCCLLRVVPLVVLLFVLHVPAAFSQKPKPRPTLKPAPTKRLAFAAAQQMLAGETEGNLAKQIVKERVAYSLTKLASGQVVELYYPVAPNIQTTGKTKVSSVPGYGVWYESEAVYREAKRPRHALEDLIPNTETFITDVPQLIARLEKRLRTKLDFSRASLRRLDSLVASVQGVLSPTETDTRLFQELTAYYGETLRRTLSYSEWKPVQERFDKTNSFAVPGLRYLAPSVNQFKLLKPGASVMNALYDEKNRGSSVTIAFDKDMETAR
jgi:hypothetical protein